MNPAMQPQKEQTRGRWILIVSGALLLGALAFLIYWGMAPENDLSFRPVTLADLKGVWTSPHPQYKDRFLQFDDSTLCFGWGAGEMGAYSIDNMDSEPGDHGTLVQVRYHDLAATDYRLVFWYVDQDHGLIRMKNQKGVYWVRTNDQPIHSPQFK